MIENLTAEQESKLDTYRDKWLEIGLSTEKTNIDEALKALSVAYAQAGLVAPTKYEIYDSPFAAITEMKLRYDVTVTPADFTYGSQDAPWLSFYDYFSKEVNLKCCDQLDGLIEFAKHSGWALLFDDLIVLTHRPCEIKFDEEEKLHCENGLAITFRDGFGVASWHGTVIPQAWVLDKASITPEVLFQWENVEQRRCACEIIGWAAVLKNLKATVIDRDEDVTIGTLLEVDLPDSGKEKFLVATDPNVKKEVGIPVPYEMKTALEANSWTYGIDRVDFKPEFRV